MKDPVVEEIRKYREQYAARFNYDLAAICKDLRDRQATCGREVVSRPPKRIPERGPATAQKTK
jgi:hypothetical protein